MRKRVTTPVSDSASPQTVVQYCLRTAPPDRFAIPRIVPIFGSAIATPVHGAPGAARLFAIKNSQGPAWTAVPIADLKIGTIRGIANLSGGAIRKQYWTTVWGDAES